MKRLDEAIKIFFKLKSGKVLPPGRYHATISKSGPTKEGDLEITLTDVKREKDGE